MKVKMNKPTGIKLFVGGIEAHTNTESMQAYFEQYTIVLHCKVEIGKKLMLPKGFGYVTVPNMKVANWLLSYEHHIDGKRVDVELALKKYKKKKQLQPEIPSETNSPMLCQTDLSKVATGMTTAEFRPVKSFLDCSNSNLRGLVSSQHLNGAKYPRDGYALAPESPIRQALSRHTGSALSRWEEAKSKALLSWQNQFSLQGPHKPLQNSQEGTNTKDGSSSEDRPKHSKYEFISAPQTESESNYRFNKRSSNRRH